MRVCGGRDFTKSSVSLTLVSPPSHVERRWDVMTFILGWSSMISPLAKPVAEAKFILYITQGLYRGDQVKIEFLNDRQFFIFVLFVL